MPIMLAKVILESSLKIRELYNYGLERKVHLARGTKDTSLKTK